MTINKTMHEFDYRKNFEKFADGYWQSYQNHSSWPPIMHEKMAIVNFGTEQQETLQKGQKDFLTPENQSKLQNPHLVLNIQIRKDI